MLRLKITTLGIASFVGLMLVAVFSAQEKTDALALYDKNCKMCHKADGKGFSGMKTPDFTDKEWQANKKDAELIGTVRKGKGNMPSFEAKLKADQIKSVIAEVIRKFAK